MDFRKVNADILFDKIMCDPVKRVELLEFLKREKGAIENYKMKLENPAKQKIQKKPVLESPTALWKRLALERPKPIESQDESSNNSIVPFNELLKGVFVYVEIFCNGIDRSGGAKSMVFNMGGKVCDTLTSGVTHVIFKDGSYCTYQKAKLLKAHLVSILWLEAVRKNKCRVSEKKYPALGLEQFDASLVLQDMQKDYEEIVEEELERSFILKIPQQKDLQMLHRETISSRLSNVNSVISALEDNNSSDCVSGTQNNEAVSTRTKLKISPKRNKSKTSLSASKLQSNNSISQSAQSKNKANRSSSVSSQTFENLINNLSKSKSSSSSTVSCSLLSYITSAKTSKTDEKLINRRQTCSVPLPVVSQDINVTRRKLKPLNENNNENNERTSNNIKRSLLMEFLETESEKVSTEEDMSSLRLSENTNSKSSNTSLRTSDNNDVILENLTTTNISRLSPASNKSTASKNTYSSTSEFSSLSSNLINNVLLKINDDVDENNVQLETPKQQNKSTARNSTKKKIQAVQIEGENASNIEDSPVNLDVAKKKPKRRRLYDITQSTDDFNLEYEKQYVNKTEANVSKVIFKKPTDFPITPINLTARTKDLLKSKKQTSNSSMRIDELLRKGKENRENLDGKTKLDDIDETSTRQTPTIPSRKSMRIKKSDDNDSKINCSFPIVPQLNRRSTLDFVLKNDLKEPKKKNNLTKMRTSIVCTRLHNPEVQEFMQIVKKLGALYVEDQVTERTSHLVVGEPKRTINILRAIARGCWILRREWLYVSLAAEKWLPEENYELTEFSPAVQQCRLQRQAFGKSFSLDIFENCGPIFISKTSEPKKSDLEELASLCKAKTTNAINRAVVVVGELAESSDAVCVSEKWMLDSIMFNTRKSYKPYLLRKSDSPIV